MPTQDKMFATYIGIRLSEDDKRALCALAGRRGISAHVRQLIQEHMKKKLVVGELGNSPTRARQRIAELEETRKTLSLELDNLASINRERAHRISELKNAILELLDAQANSADIQSNLTIRQAMRRLAELVDFKMEGL